MYARLLKRPVDIVVSLLLLALFSWLIVLIVIVYLLILEWPVFFSQERIGKDGQTFRLTKFRTLKKSGDAIEDLFWWGSFLRLSSWDELPQLVQVFQGKMSLIGPRPLLTDYAGLFSPEQQKRHQVRPGITGLAQVNGRHSISWHKKFELDIYYIKHISFGLDMLILFKTIVLLLSFRKDKSLTEEKFKGN